MLMISGTLDIPTNYKNLRSSKCNFIGRWTFHLRNKWKSHFFPFPSRYCHGLISFYNVPSLVWCTILNCFRIFWLPKIFLVYVQFVLLNITSFMHVESEHCFLNSVIIGIYTLHHEVFIVVGCKPWRRYSLNKMEKVACWLYESKNCSGLILKSKAIQNHTQVFYKFIS